MPLPKVVLDTNVILRCVSRRLAYAVVIDRLYDGAFELWVSSEILLEYEEKIADIFSKDTAELLLGAFALLPNVKKTDIHYRLQLIANDEDDNKFSDCAFACNAHYLVTNDRHFRVLKSLDLPVINVITLEAFVEKLK